MQINLQLESIVKFEESAVYNLLQGVTTGNFVDRTNNYTLDKGHKRINTVIILRLLEKANLQFHLKNY